MSSVENVKTDRSFGIAPQSLTDYPFGTVFRSSYCQNTQQLIWAFIVNLEVDYLLHHAFVSNLNKRQNRTSL